MPERTANLGHGSDSHTWAVSDPRFHVVGGLLRLVSGQSLDFETEASVTFEITATDSGSPAESVTQEFVLMVIDRDENALPWHNAALRWDVDNDGEVKLGDLLAMVAYLRQRSIPYELPLDAAEDPPPYVDVDGDGRATLSDLVEVLSRLRELPS